MNDFNNVLDHLGAKIEFIDALANTIHVCQQLERWNVDGDPYTECEYASVNALATFTTVLYKRYNKNELNDIKTIIDTFSYICNLLNVIRVSRVNASDVINSNDPILVYQLTTLEILHKNVSSYIHEFEKALNQE